MGLFDRIRAAIYTRAAPEETENLAKVEVTEAGSLLTALVSDEAMTKERALQIPTVAAALNLIKGTVRETPIKLYRRDEKGAVTEIENDNRVRLLNLDTGDTLNAAQLKDALIEDYYLYGGAYCYINKRGNTVKSLNYVDWEEVSTISNNEPIFKDYDIIVRGRRYLPHQFIKLLKDTKDGATGDGIITRNSLVLKVAYNGLKFENNLVATGGNKKGFIKSARKLGREAIAALKAAWRRLYSSNDENVVVLNEGLEFQESGNTSVEMQLNETKQTNAAEIAKLFNIPLGMLMSTSSSASASVDDKAKFAEFCILPLFEAITAALNRDLLLESEKGKYFFAFDTKEIKKGSMLERFQAYNVAIKNNIMTVDECRKNENLPALGFDFINLNLGSVLYNPSTSQGFVPNTGQTFDMATFFKPGGGDEDVDENSITY